MTLRQEYRETFKAWKYAESIGDKEAMARHAKDLSKLADLMEE